MVSDNEWEQIRTSSTPLPGKSRNIPPRRRSVIEIDRPMTASPEKPSSGSHMPLEKGALTGMNRAMAARLRQGKMPIDATLDLHGKTAAQAHMLLERFIPECYRTGKRCLLVITGKGKYKGVIYESTPIWLNEVGLREYVIAATPAHPKDGGEGALYIVLKRQR